jgi:hypothetical protein
MPKTNPTPKEEGPRAALADAQWIGLARPARASGKRRGLRLPKATVLLTPGRSREGRFRRPDWLGKLAAKRASPDEVLDELERQVRRAPTAEALREAALVLEEISRLPDAERSLGKRFSQEAVDGVTRGKGVDRVD